MMIVNASERVNLIVLFTIHQCLSLITGIASVHGSFEFITIFCLPDRMSSQHGLSSQLYNSHLQAVPAGCYPALGLGKRHTAVSSGEKITKTTTAKKKKKNMLLTNYTWYHVSGFPKK